MKSAFADECKSSQSKLCLHACLTPGFAKPHIPLEGSQSVLFTCDFLPWQNSCFSLWLFPFSALKMFYSYLFCAYGCFAHVPVCALCVCMVHRSLEEGVGNWNKVLEQSVLLASVSLQLPLWTLPSSPFYDRVSLCCPNWFGTCQDGLELRDPLSSAS